jgi:hypothetical protein
MVRPPTDFALSEARRDHFIELDIGASVKSHRLLSAILEECELQGWS